MGRTDVSPSPSFSTIHEWVGGPPVQWKPFQVRWLRGSPLDGWLPPQRTLRSAGCLPRTRPRARASRPRRLRCAASRSGASRDGPGPSSDDPDLEPLLTPLPLEVAA
jgi:hypothetical protein